jgi:acyl-CoA thioester hydrolase
MYTATTTIRIHYALTDQMGVVYHGNFAQLYEIGRGEAIRELGFTYKDIEAMGIIMPVVSLQSHFLRPAKYDDLITIKTTLKTLPANHKIVFNHEVFNEEGTLLNTAEISLYFLEVGTLKKTTMPVALQEKLASFYV